MSTITSTEYLLPGYVVSNGQTTENEWSDPSNILLVDDLLAESNPGQGVASDIIIGGFNPNLPQDAVITGIQMKLVAKRGSQTVPPISLTINAVDNLDGSDDFYPYTAPYTGLTPDLEEHILGTSTYQFATQFSVDQINNLKFQLIANGDIYVDSFLIKVYYYISSSGGSPSITAGCDTCNSPIQVQAMYLALPFLAGETKFYLQAGSLAYPDGTPVQPGDLGDCDGTIDFVFDEGKNIGDGSDNFEENVSLDTTSGYWTVLPSGIIEVDIGAVTQRGLKFHTPYDHDADLMSDHNANSKVIISNNGKFYSRFVRACQVDVVFSPPIYAYDENVLLPDPVHSLDFRGAGVSAVNDGSDSNKKIITIPGAGGTTPPTLVGTGSGTSGSVQVDELTFELPISGIDRAALIQISTEEGVSVVSVDVGGSPASQLIAETDAVNNIRQEQWGITAPPVGTITVTITLSAVAYISAGGESFANVDQVTTFGATQSASGNDNNPTQVLNTTVEYSLVVDGLATALTPILYTPGSDQVANWSETANADTRQGGSSTKPAGTAPDAVTMEYSITQSTDWCYTAVEVIGVTVAGGVQSVTDDGNNVVVVDNTDPTNPIIGFNGVYADGVTITGNGSNGNPLVANVSPSLDELVGVSATDTTPDYLSNKIDIISSDGSVTITPSILNPAGNEVYQFDLTAAGGAGGGASIITADAGEDIDAGETVYIAKADGLVYLTDASTAMDEAVERYRGIATSTSTTGNPVTIATTGVVTGLPSFGDPTTTVAETTDFSQTAGGSDWTFTNQTYVIERVYKTGQVANMTKLELNIKKVGTPTGTLRIGLKAINVSGVSTGSYLISRDFTSGDVTTGYVTYDIFNGAGAIAIEPNTYYVVKAEISSGVVSGTDTYRLERDSGATTITNGWLNINDPSLSTGIDTGNILWMKTYYTEEFNYNYGDKLWLTDTPGAMDFTPGTIRKKAGRLISETSVLVETMEQEDLIKEYGFRQITSGSEANRNLSFQNIRFPIPVNARKAKILVGGINAGLTQSQVFLEFPIQGGAATSNSFLGSPIISDADGAGGVGADTIAISGGYLVFPDSTSLVYSRLYVGYFS